MLIDFTHVYDEDMLVGGSLPCPTFTPRTSSSPHPGGRILSTAMTLASHVGTHIDAPVHFIPDGPKMGELALETFTGRAAVVVVEKDPGEPISLADVTSGGPTPGAGDMLVINTGWWRHYLNRDKAKYLDAPYVSPSLAEWCVAVGLKLVATDTVSPDPPMARRASDYPMTIHYTLLSSGVLIGENLNLKHAERGWYEAYAFPMVTAPGDGGPTRFIVKRE
jgi:arylformamidase